MIENNLSFATRNSLLFSYHICMWYIFASVWHFLKRFPGRSLLFSLIIGVFIVCVHGLLFLNDLLDRTGDYISQRLTLTLYVKDEYSEESRNMQNFLDELAMSAPPIGHTYLSKDVALDIELQRNPDLLSILWWENPLPDTVILEAGGEHVETLYDIIQRYNYLFIERDTEAYQEFQTQVERIASFQRNFMSLQIAVWVLLGIFFLSIAFFVFLFLQNHAFLFEKEMRIALLSWATPRFIMMPYILFALFLWCWGFLVAVVATWYMGNMWPLSSFELPLANNLSFTFRSFFLASIWKFIAEAGIIVLICFLAGYFWLSPSIRKAYR